MVRPLSCATEDIVQQAAVLTVDDGELATESLGFFLNKHYDVDLAETRVDTREKLPVMACQSGVASIGLGLLFSRQVDDDSILTQDVLAAVPAMCTDGILNITRRYLFSCAQKNDEKARQ